MNYYNYFTEVEEHFVHRRGKHMFISPLDWSLVATWRESGVPLHVALRGVDIAMDAWHSKPHSETDRLSTLFYCHNAVMAEFARHLEAHLGEANGETTAEATASKSRSGPETAEMDKKTLLEFLEARIHEIETVRAKQYPCGDAAGIERILSRLEEIRNSATSEEHPEMEALERDLGMLDELLVSLLREKLAKETLEEWEQDAKRELKVYKKQLDKETYQKILHNFLRDKMHRLFGVGELSLFYL